MRDPAPPSPDDASRLTRALRGLARLAERRHRTVFAVVALLLVLAALSTARLRLDPDILSLLPAGDPVVETFRDALEAYGGLDLLLIVVRIPEDASPEPYQALVDRLGPALGELDTLDYVDYALGDPTDLLRGFLPRAPLFLDDAGRAAVAERLAPDALIRRAGEIRRLLTTPQALARKDLLQLDPADLAPLFLERLAGGGGPGGLGIDWTSGHYLSADGRLLLLLAKPTQPAQDIGFTERLVAEVERVVETVVDADWDASRGPAPAVVLGGGYLTALDDATLIRRDVIVNAASSMIVVLLLFLFAFRRLGLLLYAFLPLSAGLLLTFGVAGATVGTLGAATSGFAALLIGLGIDFVIVSYGRFVEERRAGADASRALQRMMVASGPAVVVGGVTSAATFYAFSLTEFTGLRQMGALTATGILLCMVLVLVLLPSMLAWSEQRRRRSGGGPTLYLHGFGAERIVALALARPRVTLAAGALVTLAALAALPRLQWEDSIQNMRPEGNRGIEVAEEVAHHFGSNFEYMMLLVRGETAEDARALAAEAAAGARPLVDDGTLRGVDAIDSLIPPPAQQRAALDWLAAGRADGTLDPARVSAQLRAALRDAGLNPAAFDDGVTGLAAMLALDAPIDVASLQTGADAAAAGGLDASRLIARYLRPLPEADGGGWQSVVYLYAPPRVWKRAPPPAAEALVADLGPQAELTGVNVVSRLLRVQVRQDAVFAAVVGTLAVLVLLWLDYRRLSDALLALVPLFVGIVWMIGAMVALGIAMNFMNIFVTTMIIGIGVDYGIHMLHRNREVASLPPGDPAFAAGLAQTGKAIVMAAASTLVGFGGLILSHYPGLRSIGYVAILGTVAASLTAITLLPAYLALRRRG
ncbi:MAG: MMPL family transporter [Acidobacteriota bacterium]